MPCLEESSIICYVSNELHCKDKSIFKTCMTKLQISLLHYIHYKTIFKTRSAKAVLSFATTHEVPFSQLDQKPCDSRKTIKNGGKTYTFASPTNCQKNMSMTI